MGTVAAWTILDFRAGRCMNIRQAVAGDGEALAGLVAGFRAAMGRLRGREARPDVAAGREEIAEYEAKGYPIFVAEAEGSGLVGYIVCRVDGKTVWAESLYVVAEHRRKGVASALYAEAERLAEGLGSETVYNWVDPDNDAIIAFLAGRGYDVLNLVEVRRARAGEKPTKTVAVGRHRFRR